MSLIEQAAAANQQLSDDYPAPKQGRVVHIDADFLAYWVSAESKEQLDGDLPRKPVEDMLQGSEDAAVHIARQVGATRFVCHITAPGSTKGGRSDQAVQAEYQAARASRDNRPEHLDTVKRHIQTLRHSMGCGVGHLDQEADDGLAQAAYGDTSALCVIASNDKDLRMCPGWHFNPGTGELIEVADPFGFIEIDDTKSAKKVVGYGTKFFWAQCLMGDSADGIPGVPVVAGVDYLNVQPTAEYSKLYDQIKAYSGDRQHEQFKKLVARAKTLLSKTKKCGPVLTYDLLKDCTTDQECFETVKRVFKFAEMVGGWEFKHWRTGERVKPAEALLGDMLLLWMRRNKNPRDVVAWLKEKAK